MRRLQRLGAPFITVAADLYTWYTAQTAWRMSCAQVASHLPPLGGGQVLADIGCGPGFSTFEQARARPAALVVGVDVVPRVLANAQRLVSAERLPADNVRWLRADATQLPFATCGLAAVTSHSFLYYLPARGAILSEILRVLQPGGRFVTMEPSASSISIRQMLRVSRDPRFIISMVLWRPFSRLHTRFTTRSLCATLAEAGFANCDAEETLGGLGIVAWADKELA